VQIIQANGVGVPELGISPGAGAQIKNQEPDPEFSWKFWTGAGVMDIWELTPGPFQFLDTNACKINLRVRDCFELGHQQTSMMVLQAFDVSLVIAKALAS